MRSAEFDREKVLRSAMNAFMHKGYSKTSMQDLTKATGLHPGSIYCAFESKRGLLLAALEQYRLDRNAEFNKHFSDDQPVILQLKCYLDNVVAECLSCDASQACLLTKALNELAEQDEEIQQRICQNLSSWQQAIAKKFALAISQKQLITNQTDTQLAQFFVMGIYGLRTFAYTHPKAEDLQNLADQLFLTCTGRLEK